MEEVTWSEIIFIWFIIGIGALFLFFLERSSKDKKQ